MDIYIYSVCPLNLLLQELLRRQLAAFLQRVEVCLSCGKVFAWRNLAVLMWHLLTVAHVLQKELYIVIELLTTLEPVPVEDKHESVLFSLWHAPRLTLATYMKCVRQVVLSLRNVINYGITPAGEADA